MATTDKQEFILFDTDLTTRLQIIPALSGHLYLELNEPGSGEVSLPLGTNSATAAASGQLVSVNYRGVNAGNFFVENLGKKLSNQDENAGKVLSLSGRGGLALLEDAIVWDDGAGGANRTFTSMTKAAILITLIQEAQARGGLSSLTYGFTSSVDSNGTAWTDAETITLTAGTSLLEVVRRFITQGMDVWLDPATFSLEAYSAGKGSDKSETIYFRVGTNCEEVFSDERGADIKNVLRVAYKGGYLSVTDPTSISNRRRREKVLDLKNAQTSDSATTYAAAEVAQSKDPQKSISVKIYDGVGPRAFLDYDLGDYITLDVEGVETKYRIYGMQLNWTDDNFADVVVDLNSILYDHELKMSQDLDWLLDQWEGANDANQLAISFWATPGASAGDVINTVNCLKLIGDNLYVGGYFSLIGGVNANGIAVYNIKTGKWSAPSDPATDPLVNSSITWVESFTLHGTSLYVGGLISGDCGGVLRYDTTDDTWHKLGTGLLAPSLIKVRALATVGNYIYATGYFNDAGGVSVSDLARWDTVGLAWSDVGGGLTHAGVGAESGMGYAFAVVGSTLYIGGDFDQVAGSMAVKFAVSWNGTSFTALGSTLDNTVRCLKVSGSNILAGGSFTGYLAEWNGSTWSTVGGGVDARVNAIDVYLTDIYIGGSFTDVGEHVAKYSGGSWQELSTGFFNIARTVLYNDGVLYIGGDNQFSSYISTFQALVNYLEDSASSDFDMGAAIHNAPASAITDADEVPFWEDISNALRKITFANLWVAIKAKSDLLYVALTGNQSVAGIKTFSSFPVTPSSAPTANYEVANKKYVDDNIGGGGTPGGSDTEIQYNDAGAFGASAKFYWDKTYGIVNLGGAGGNPSFKEQTTLLNLIAPQDDAQAVQTSVVFGDGSTVYNALLGYRSGGTKATPTALGTGQIMLNLAGLAYDGAAWSNNSIARILFKTTEAQTAAHHGAAIFFEGVPNLSTTRREFGKVVEGGFDVPTGSEYLINGLPHTHKKLDNALINGGFDFFQRAAPATATAMTDDVYNSPDRWYSLVQGANATINRNAGIGTSKYSCKLVAGGTTNRYGIAQIIESANSLQYRGNTVIAQCKIKPVNNAGSGTRNYRIAILEWTGTADAVTSELVADWTSATYTTAGFFASTTKTLVATASVTATHNTETTLSVSGTVSASCNNLIIFIWTEAVPTHAADYVLIGEAGLYYGATIQTWMPRPYAEEYQLCTRHCRAWTNDSVNTSVVRVGYGTAYGASEIDFYNIFTQPMFSTPTISLTGGWTLVEFATGGSFTVSSVSVAGSTNENKTVTMVVTPATAVTGGRIYAMTAGTTNEYKSLMFSAEL